MIEIKKIRKIEDFKKIPEIEQNAWGFSKQDTEPHHLMTRVQKYGGLIQGLFLDKVLIGFTYAILSKWKGEYFMYSHMTAVIEEFQGRGYGFKLKKAQREEILRMGYNIIRWNFDPLESINAYFNFHKLGVVSDEYDRNIYGAGKSGLHKDLPTDRLIATWELNSKRVKEKMDNRKPSKKESVDDNLITNFSDNPSYIEIPKNIRILKKKDIKKAFEWQKKIRTSFESAFKKGFIANDIVFSKNKERIFIKLQRKNNNG